MFTSFLVLIIFSTALAGVFYLNKRQFFTMNMTHWILAIYSLVLLSATVALPFSANQRITNQDYYSNQEIDSLIDDFYNNLYAGNIEAVVENHQLSKQSFPFNGQTLTINYSGINSPTIFISETSPTEKTIEVYSLISGFFIEGINLADRVMPFEFSLENNTLLVDLPHQTTIQGSLIKKEFTINQFLNKVQDSLYATIKSDSPTIFIKTPPNITVKSDPNLNLVEVNK